MADMKITCPTCHADVPLTESLAGPLLAAERAASAKAIEAERAKTAKVLEAERARLSEEALAAAEAKMQDAAARQAAESRAALAERDRQMADLRAEAAVTAEALKASRQAEVEARKKERALAEREASLELETERRVAALLKDSETKLRERLSEAEAGKTEALRETYEQKLEEARQQSEIMRRQVEEMKRKAEQGSMQVQGEAAEVRLEDRLSRAFPADEIGEVKKGARGADCLQVVATSAGIAGRIIWEVKETQQFSKDWLPKLRDDMRAAGAEIAVLVSRVRPDGITTFAEVDGVWIAAPGAAVPLAQALRHGLIEAAAARGQREGQATKTEMLYDYLTGPNFRARVHAVVEPFAALEDALNKEKRRTMLDWAAREKQLEKAQMAMMGMYGDVKGIAGAAVPEIEGLDQSLLEDD